MKLLIFSCCILLCSTTVYAQNKTSWALAPNAAFTEVESFSQGIAQVRLEDKWHYLSPTSDSFKISSDGYRKAEAYSCGLALVRLEDGKYQFRNPQGELVGKKYVHAHSYHDGFAAVQKAAENAPVELYGFIDTRGKKKIPHQYMYVGTFSEKWFPTLLNPNAKMVMLDTAGNHKQTAFNSIDVFSEGVAYAYDDHNALGYVNSELNPITDFKKGRYGRSFSEGFAPMSDQLPHLNYIDKEGKIAFSFTGGTFSEKELKKEEDLAKMDIHKFSEDLAAVKQNNKWGYINKNGEWVIPAKYQKVTRFSEGTAAVLQGNEWFFINKKDSILQKDGFVEAKPRRNGKAWVKVKLPHPSNATGWGLIAFDGNTKCEVPLITIQSPHKEQQDPVMIQLDCTLKARIVTTLELNSIVIRVNGKEWSDVDSKRIGDTVFMEQKINFPLLGKQELCISATNLCGTSSASMTLFCDTTIKYYALLIANNRYPRTKDNQGRIWLDLTYPISDAAALGKILTTDYQFKEVEVAWNATYAVMKQALHDFAKKHTNPNDHLLIFYAGHGSDAGQPCLITSDNNCFDCNDLTKAVNEMSKVNQVLFIVDACFGGSFLLDQCNQDVNPPLMGNLRGSGTDTLTAEEQADRRLKNNPAKADSLNQYIPNIPILPIARYMMTSAHAVKVPDNSPFIKAFLTVLNRQESDITAGFLKEAICKMMPQVELYPQYNMLQNTINKGGWFIFRKKT